MKIFSVLKEEKKVNSFHLVISTTFRLFDREKVTFVVLFVFVCSVNDTVHGEISDIIV